MRNVWKSLNLISIVVLTSVNIISPLTYAQLEDFSVQENISTNDSRVITPDGEEIVQGTEAWEKYINSLDILDGENEMVDDFIEEPQNEEETQEKSELDIARETLNSKPIILIKYFKELGIIVKVKAQAGSFPEGTYVDILSVQGDEQAQIKEQIVNDPNNDISEEDVVIVFDIKFVYTLSDGTGVEVQPRENAVEVTFDYERNEELREADQSEDQEIQIYHIDDKDENGEKVAKGEEVVEKMNINATKSENLENGVVIDAESFSIYAVIRSSQTDSITITYNANGGTFNEGLTTKQVTYTKDANGLYIASENVQAPNKAGRTCENNTLYCMFDGWYTDTNYTTEWLGVATDTDTTSKTVYAKWIGFDDLDLDFGNTTYTIMDRNLGASAVAQGLHKDDNSNNPEDLSRLGYHYQWGNNYGFNGSLATLPYTDTNMVVNTTSKPRGPGNYYSSATFIKISSTPARWDDADNHNLWGGETDGLEAKQGPCPTGYHIPTNIEWQEIYDTFDVWRQGDGSAFCSNYSNAYKCFTAKLKLPFAGRRSRDYASIIDRGNKALYLSSVAIPNDPDDSYCVDITSSRIEVQSDCYRANGYSVRCFKDSPKLSYTLTGDDTTRNNFQYSELPAIQGSNGKQYILMDRNLGATTNDISNPDSYGYYYQWGNNYGFSSNTTAGQAGTVTVDPIYIPSKFSRNIWSTEEARTTENNLWGDTTDREWARQGPCPAGWHVPSTTDWKNITSAWCTSKGYSSSCSSGDEFSQDLKMPEAGRRKTNLSYENVGYYGYYWSSTTTSQYSNELFFGGTTLNGFSYVNARSYGFPIRCMKNTTQYTVTFHPNNSTSNTTQSVIAGEFISQPDDPTNGTLDFAGWYRDSGFSKRFDFSSAITGNTHLYARWVECPTGTSYSALVDACSKTTPTPSADGLVYYWTDENNKDVISVKDPDSDTILTILDKNLGATSNVITNTGSYGYHFQRGNNYGFAQLCPDNQCTDDITSAATDTKAIYKNYRPGNPYSSGTFIKGYANYWDIARVGGSDVSNFDALWGGLGDAGTTTSVDTFWGGIKNGATRRGPCDSGYHVPSMGEWNALITYWYNAKHPSSKKTLTGLNSFDDDNLKEDFKLPLGGRRKYDTAALATQGDFSFYWSSSPASASSSIARNFLLYSTVTATHTDNRAFGNLIRCFKDHPDAPTTLTYTFNQNGGNLLGAEGGTLIQKVASGKKVQQPVDPTKDNAEFSKWTTDQAGTSQAFDFSEPITSSTTLYAQYDCNSGYAKVNGECEQEFTVTFNPNNGESSTPVVVVSGNTVTAPTPEKVGYTLKGWHLTGSESLFNFSTAITGDITLYAKWRDSRCDGDEDWYDEIGACATKSDDKLVYYWTGTDGKGLISIKDPNGDTILTMMDKNEGAENVGDYGDHFQWGNNYGFAQSLNITSDSEYYSSTEAKYENYWPGNSYDMSLFRYGNYWENNKQYPNLWGGGNDTSTATNIDTFWGGIKNGDTRQGPCEDGYHVPSMGEWNALVTYWYNQKKNESDSYTQLHNYSEDNLGGAFLDTFKLPVAGRRSSGSATPHLYGHALYWSSTPVSDSSAKAYYWHGTNSSIITNNTDPKLYGYSVRCFKDSPDAPATKIITFHENGGDILGAEGTDGQGTLNQLVASGNIAQSPIGVTKTGGTFLRWADIDNNDATFNLTNTTITRDVNLKAVFEMLPKTITYNPNGGAFSGMAVNATKNVVFTYDGDKYVPDINIQFPNREGYMFDGWYTSSGTQTSATEWTGYVDASTTVTEVFAKWLTFQDLEVKDDNGNTLFTIMDRNLGATTTGTTCSSSNLPACGKLFQWGNNYGFDNSTSPWPYRTGSASVPYTDLVDASAYGPGNYYSSSTFILRPDGSDYYRWDKTDNANLWGGAGDTATSRGPGTDADRQGPCLANYHVPSILEWKSAYNLLGLTPSAEGVTKLQTKLWLPFAGYRYRGNSNVNYQGSNGGYWSSTRAYGFGFDSSNFYPQSNYDRSHAFSVRCFKDSPTQTLTFVREDAGTVDSKQVYWYEPIQSSYKPSAPSGTTETWYTDAELTSPFTFGSTTYVTQAKTLYSKVTCNNSSYIWNGTACIQQFTVTLNASQNGGTIEGQGTKALTITNGSTFEHSNYTGNKANYTFVGWSESETGTGVITSNPTITSNRTFYAVFNKDLTATFNANGATSIGNNSLPCTMWNNATSCTVVAPSITRDGWDKLGWSTSANAQTASVSVGGDITLTANTPYYAITSKDYTANFTLLDSDAATLSAPTSSCTAYNQGTCTITAPTMTPKSGYVVDGWSATSGSTEIITTFTAGNTYYSVTHNDTPLVDTFTVQDENAVTKVGGETQCYKYNGEDSCQITAPNLSEKAGYTAVGWNTDADARDSSLNPNTSKKISANENYYSITYDSTPLTAKFNLNGAAKQTDSEGEEVADDVTRSCYKYNGSNSCDIVTPTIVPNEGFDVLGYNTDETAEESILSEDTVRTISSDEEWSVITESESPIVITFNVNGNGGSTDTRECYRYNGNDSCSITSPDIVPALGFTKIGWSNAVSTHISEWDINTPRDVTENDIYYAQSQKAGYSVNLSYTKGNGVFGITPESNICSVATVYNGEPQVGCSQTAPDVECLSGYSNPEWNPNLSTLVLEDTDYTAICSDSEKPVCSITTQPTTTGMSLVDGHSQGTITFTCTDNVGVTTDNISASNITYNSNIVTLSNFTTGGDAAAKTFTFTYTAKSEGSTTFTLKAGAVSDLAGNSNDATVSSDSVTVDTTAPSLSFTDGVSDAYVQTDVVTVSWGDASVKKYTYTTSDTCPSISGSYTTTTATSFDQTTEENNGKYICLYAEDQLGNSATLRSEKTIHIDTTAPAITFDQESGSAAQSHSVTVTATDTGSKLFVQSSGGDGWYTATLTKNGDGSRTITYDGKSYTVASSDLPGTYYWGNNYPDIDTANGGDNSGIGIGQNNIWGGGSDNASNGYNPNPSNYDERKGPCDPGYHVPSRGEWTAIMTAWCHLDTNGCTSSDISAGYINNSTLAGAFKSDFGMTNGNYWSSSPTSDGDYTAWLLVTYDNYVGPNGYYNRDYNDRVRCLKNSTSAGTPLDLKYRWQTDSTCSTDESDYISTGRNSDDVSNTTATVTTEGLVDGSYYLCVLSGSISDNAGNTNITTNTSGVFVVDNTAPTIEITQPNPTEWTKSKTVSATSDGTLTMKESTNSTCNSGVQGFVAYESKTYSLESNNGTYICYKAVDSAGNEAYLSSAKVEKIDTTAPTLVSKTSFENTWYTQNPTSTFTYTDTGAGISGTNTRTCEITQEGSASTCKIENVSVCDIAGNCNTDDQTSNPVKLDRTQPVCGTWTYQPISQTNTGVTATLVDSTDATSGIKTAGGTCTLTSNATTCDVTIEDNAGLTRVCTSESVNNIDKVKPEGTIQVVTSTPKSTSQEVKLICSDNVGVSSYYWGPNSNPATTAYTSIATQISYETTKTVDAAGTYYLLCQDEAGNVSDSKSQVYNSYEVHDMLNAVDKNEGTYNSTNYPQDGSTATYIAPAGTEISFSNVYTIPTYSSLAKYVGYTTGDSGEPLHDDSIILNSDSTYYFWFDRTKYDLNLVKNIGIETIYYKVNGVNSYSSTGVTTSVPMKAGSNVYAYAVADEGYTLAGEFVNYNSTNPKSFTTVTEDKTFSPVTTINTYTITWKDGDGEVLKTETLEYGTTPAYIGQTPTKTATAKYSYTFNNTWDPAIVDVSGDATYIAQFDSTVNTYPITWKYRMENGTETTVVNNVAYGTTPTAPTLPTTSQSESTVYTFTAWDSEIVNVNGAKTYTAQYTQSAREYPITWKYRMENGTETTVVNNVAYGTKPTAPTLPTTSQSESTVYTFTAWDSEIVNVNGAKTYTAQYTQSAREYTIVWKDYDGSVLSGAIYHYNDNLIVPVNPSRAADSSYTYEFKGWNPAISDKVVKDVEYIAEYNAISKGGGSSGGGGGSSGGGGRPKTPSPIEVVEETIKDNTHNAADEDIGTENEGSESIQTKTDNLDKMPEPQYSPEMVEAYQFAKKNGITTTLSIQKAKMNTNMTRIEMAKMLSNYAINVLGKKPDVSKGIIKFEDVTNKMNRQYNDAVIKAYQLGIMGQNMKNNKFRPNDEVTRAEFATALSRLLYNTEEGKYKGTGKYYLPHMAKLYNEGIINKADPKMKDKRGYVMIMLMRTVK